MADLWWKIKYFERRSYEVKEFDSSWMLFKSLPCLDECNIRLGHQFNTTEFEISIPGSDIRLHMPSQSLWVGETAYYVPGATRVVLFKKTLNYSDKPKQLFIYLGLLNEVGIGRLIKFDATTGEIVTKTINIEIPVPIEEEVDAR